MNKKIGVIGCGNMAQAIIGGIISSNLIEPDKLMVSDISEDKLNIVKRKYDVHITKENNNTAEFADILILAIKPHLYGQVVEGIKESVKKNAVIVTIAPGISMNFMENILGNDSKIIRTMPNTPALVGEGMSAICNNDQVNEEELSQVIDIFESFGKVEMIEEDLMNTITAISGSSPAYVYMFIEALADGGVLGGLPRDKAYRLAAQSVLGSAKMVLETEKHPGELKDNVCSPAGTTIEAVYSLEKNNFRGTIIEAVERCADKCIKMSEDNN